MLKRLWSTKPYPLDFGLLILRVVMAGLMMPHGWAKFTHYAERAEKFADPLGVSRPVSLMLTIFAELFCSGFLLIGLFTRYALIPLMFAMIVIVTIVHGSDPLDDKEHALLFLAPFILLFLSGPGRYSVDGLLKK